MRKGRKRHRTSSDLGNRRDSTAKGQKGKSSKRAKTDEAPMAALDNRSFDEYMQLVEPLERAADRTMTHDGGHDGLGEPVNCMSWRNSHVHLQNFNVFTCTVQLYNWKFSGPHPLKATEVAKKQATLAAETRDIDAESHVQLVDALIAIGKETEKECTKGEKYLPDELSCLCGSSISFLVFWKEFT